MANIPERYEVYAVKLRQVSRQLVGRQGVLCAEAGYDIVGSAIVVVNLKMCEICLLDRWPQPGEPVIDRVQLSGHRHRSRRIQCDVGAAAVGGHSGIHPGTARDELIRAFKRVQRGATDNENFQVMQFRYSDYV